MQINRNRGFTWILMCFFLLLNELGKNEKCEACREFNRFFRTNLTKSNIQHHELLSRHMRFPTM